MIGERYTWGGTVMSMIFRDIGHWAAPVFMYFHGDTPILGSLYSYCIAAILYIVLLLQSIKRNPFSLHWKALALHK